MTDTPRRRSSLPAGPDCGPPRAACEPHRRQADAAEAMDQQASVLMAQLWSGLSPISLTLAATDWALHVLSSPGSQRRLARQAAELGQAWWQDAWRAGMGTVTAFLAPGVSGAAAAGTGEAGGGSGTQGGPGDDGAQAEDASPLARALREDARYADPAWQRWPWSGLASAGKALELWWQQAAALRGMQPHSREQMRFYGRQWLDAWAPSNVLWTNPQALQRAWETGGQSLVKGWGRMVEDVQWRLGLQPPPRRFDPELAPRRGLATTPGQVVLRNALIELIQYAPTTPTVQREPVLVIPSCIMKYYILDLSPHNSLVRWLVGQGHTVYIVSWKNPDEDDALLAMDDYVRDGVLAALDHVRCATGAPVHLMGYCLGGTFAAIAAAALGGGDARLGCQYAVGAAEEGVLASLTLLAAETDFKEPGELGILIDEAQVRLLEDMMAARGYLTGQQMAGSFQFLHSRELVWSSQTRRWLLGEDEVGNDLMAWNADVTRLPAVMHSQYLRSCYLNNDLAEGRFQFEGQPIALRDIRVPVFAVGTVKDHVAPWRSVYKIHHLVSADVTFALTNGGHNAGIVSEPGHRGRYHHLLTTPADHPWRTPDEWLAAAPRLEGSWWPSWSAWLKQRGSGQEVPARQPPQDPALGPAPGRYVMVRYGD
ncbi:Poly(3-hydroxyalkanoate) polymerase subunit PhaC [Tepidimonas fonticaldi]|uniref:Poly(3-hydroxyalkanoate) polymerase subunit PhaC n=1 Tax=Tepidimonas fonticaldi TaxID=1101373 RepID=A0A554XG18_9BURK|nr:alpha/beta fold hydrolase [Tepidimonas fonticaldi]TSE34765.1 Poly(3-hydroxyalkanoate) polymerase subunit PhaC [Tepidimonas fonticaldi]